MPVGAGAVERAVDLDPALPIGAPPLPPHGVEARPGQRQQRRDVLREHVGLAGPHIPHEHEALAPPEEREREQAGASEALRPRDRGPAVAVKRLRLRQPASSMELRASRAGADGAGTSGSLRRSPAAFPTEPFSLPESGLRNLDSKR